MYISPTSNYNYNRTYQPSFNRKVTYFNKDLPATLETTTINSLRTLQSGFHDILEKLKMKTPEGIKFIQENFPNITIGEGLTFHNCGEDKTSILFRTSESEKNKGLVRIIERQSDSTWGNRIVKRAYLIEDGLRLIKTDNPNNPNIYPQERVYYTEGEFEDQNIDNELNGLLSLLDESMLKFRLFLNKTSNLHIKPSEGRLNTAITSTMEQISNNTKKLETLLAKLPRKTVLELKRSYSNYKPTTGSSTQVFQNLGPEGFTISYHEIDSAVHKDLNRLSMFDKEGNLVKTFIVSSDGKMVKNLNQNHEKTLPQTLTFFDSKEIATVQDIPIYEKALKLYYNELINFNAYIERYIKEREEKLYSVPDLIPENSQDYMNNVLNNLTKIQDLLKQLDATTAADLKKEVENLFAPPGRKGVTFDGFKNDKRVYLLPVKSNLHSGLTRLTITHKDGVEESYLIKDSTFIVKNYNPDYPQVIPKVLIYKTKADADIDLSEALEFLDSKTNDYLLKVEAKVESIQQEKAAKRLERENKALKLKENKEQKRLEKEKLKAENSRKRVQERKDIEATQQKKKAEKEKQRLIREENIKQISIKKQQKQERNNRRDLLKACKMQLAEISKNINSTRENFNNIVQDLQEKIKLFLEQNK